MSVIPKAPAFLRLEGGRILATTNTAGQPVYIDTHAIVGVTAIRFPGDDPCVGSFICCPNFHVETFASPVEIVAFWAKGVGVE